MQRVRVTVYSTRTVEPQTDRQSDAASSLLTHTDAMTMNRKVFLALGDAGLTDLVIRATVLLRHTVLHISFDIM